MQPPHDSRTHWELQASVMRLRDPFTCQMQLTVWPRARLQGMYWNISYSAKCSTNTVKGPDSRSNRCEQTNDAIGYTDCRAVQQDHIHWLTELGAQACGESRTSMPTLPVSDKASSAFSRGMPISSIAVRKRWFTILRARCRSLLVLCTCARSPNLSCLKSFQYIMQEGSFKA